MTAVPGTDQTDLLAQLDVDHPLLRLARAIDWAACAAAAAPHPARLMLGLHLLRILRGLSDPDLCDLWGESPYFQAFCGGVRFCHRLDLGPAELASWRAATGVKRLAAWVATVLPTTEERPSTFVIDVDGVVATLTPDNDYRLAEAIPETVAAINRLYDRGHRIIMLTARGSMTGICWEKVTRDQFALWGLNYHELHFGKPAADYYIDDRLVSVGMMSAMASGRAFPPSSCAVLSRKFPSEQGCIL